MARCILGLDIGSRNIKLVFAKPGRPLKLLKTASVLTPLNSVADGDLRNIDAICQAVKNAINESRLKVGGLYISMNSPHAIIREVKLPPLKRNELDAAIEFELSQYYPGVAQTHTISFKIHSSSPDAIEGIAAFCPTKLSEGYLELSKKLGIPLKSIDVNSNTLAKAFGAYSRQKNEPGPVMLVDIGITNSQVNVIDGGRLIFCRHIASGASSVDTIAANRLGINLEQAERARVNNKYSIYNVNKDELQAFARLGFSAVEDQIRQTLDFFAFNKSKAPVKRILITGGGSLFPGLAAYFKDLFGVPVSVLTADVIGVTGNDNMQLILPALGACLRSEGEYSDIDLFPDLKQIEKDRAKAGRMTVAVACGVIIALIGIASYTLMMVLTDSFKLKEAIVLGGMKEYAGLNQTKNSIAAYEERIKQITAIIESTDAQSLSNTGILTDIGNAMKDSVFMTNLTVTGNSGYSLTGVSKDRHSIADFMYRLNGNDEYASITARSIEQKDGDDGRPLYYNFSLDIKLKGVGMN